MSDSLEIWLLIFGRSDFQLYPGWCQIFVGVCGHLILLWLCRWHPRFGVRACVASSLLIHLYGLMCPIGFWSCHDPFTSMLLEVQQIMSTMILNIFAVTYSVLAFRYVNGRARIATILLIGAGLFVSWFIFVQLLYAAQMIDCPTRMALELI